LEEVSEGFVGVAPFFKVPFWRGLANQPGKEETQTYALE
jgi:hypothetical protein